MINPSRIKGSFMGALAGDCIGRIFEWKTDSKDEISAVEHCLEVGRFIRGLPVFAPRLPLPFSDDSAMAKCVARSLVECRKFDEKHMAKLFCDSYFEQPDRGYGRAPPILFKRFRDEGFADVYGPAEDLFNGRGSLGNGGAMRVFPVALFYSKNLEEALRIAKDQCRITHSNPLAITGSVLQTAAVHSALNASSQSFNADEFIRKLKIIAESEEYCCNKDASKPYIDAFERFASLAGSSPYEIARSLGNGIEAHTSVPAAIFSFLHSFGSSCQFSDIQDPILRTITFAVSLNGDTDTIATMAAAISGAFYGNTLRDGIWEHVFEGYADYVALSNAMIARANEKIIEHELS